MEKAVYTGPFQPTLNTEYENIIVNTSNFLTGIELDVIFSLLNSSGTEMITCSMIHPGHGANIILHG